LRVRRHALAERLTFGRMAPGIGVSDMARSVAFYTEVLGFEVSFQNGDPVQFTLLERDKTELHLLLAPGHRGPAFNVAHLIVDDVDALHARCVAAGAPVIKALADKDYGMRAFVFADPDGNRIDVGTPD
jgi:catechol 2,3-dioxygenase-like lactoylglutathione lyase family enzyme